MRIALVTHKSGEQLPLLLDSSGMPIAIPNEFILSRRSLSTNTLNRNLRELSVLYQWLEKQGIDLLERLRTPLPFNEAELRGGLIEALRLKSSDDVLEVVKPNTFNQRLTTVRQYLSWVLDMCLSQLSVASKEYEQLRAARGTILKILDSSFMSKTPQNRAVSKGLTDTESRFLLEILEPKNEPDSVSNPAVKYRNYISVALMLYCGLRPGELLSLRVEDITIGAISSVRVLRRPEDPLDKRTPRPRIKRNGRVIPLDDRHLISCLDQYILTWREVLEQNSVSESEYLILSDEGAPLSISSLTQFFQILRTKFTNKLPSNLTAKSLRHRFSSQLERTLRQAGHDEHRRREALAYMRGDSSLSSQDTYIAQEIEEQASAALRNYQRKILDT